MTPNEQARANAEKITRQQTLRTMEQLIVTLGGKSGYIKWLEAMPANAVLTNSGSVSSATLMDVAGDELAYAAATKAFAAYMAPVLAEMAGT